MQVLLHLLSRLLNPSLDLLRFSSLAFIRARSPSKRLFDDPIALLSPQIWPWQEYKVPDGVLVFLHSPNLCLPTFLQFPDPCGPFQASRSIGSNLLDVRERWSDVWRRGGMR